ncbi:STAS domain-containing protein [Candidatus Pelagibacter sp.]|nr:STAS domain-containing protein [Candidatus Pelagibacter sp.]
MDIREENLGTKLIAHIDGEIDLDKTDDLREKISEIIHNHSSIELNLTKVTYIDSSGVAVLIESNQKAQELGKDLSLNLSEAVLSVLKMAKLESFFKMA